MIANVSLRCFLASMLLLTAGSALGTTVIDGTTLTLPSQAAPSTRILPSKKIAQTLMQAALTQKPSAMGFEGVSTHLSLCQSAVYTMVNVPHLEHPLFVVGDNQVSLNWVRQYRQRLAKLGAVGLVIQANTLASIRHIQRAAGHLPLVIASGDALESRFGLTCYPVLISKHRIEG